MIKLRHHDDGKEKWQSHEICMMEENFYNADYDVFSHNPFDISGYGFTKEEAIEEFKKKFKFIMDELRAIEMMLLDTDIMTVDIVEVDCFGKPIDIK